MLRSKLKKIGRAKEQNLSLLRHLGGFTIIELMVAVAIVGVLATIAVPAYTTYREKALVARTIADLRVISNEIHATYIVAKVLPSSLAEINLDSLLDPWGNPFQYLKIDGGDKGWKGKARKDRFLVPVNSDFDLYSMGPDGDSKPPFPVPVSQDDIVRANDGGYFGKVSKF